jgi:Mg-chelatase subunit ChlD
MTTALDTRKAVVKGSLADVAQSSRQSLAQTFVNAEVVILVDTSGSMNTADSRGGRKRYDVAVEELTALQAQLPGKVAVLSFSGQVMFCPSGTPYFFGATTDMAEALRFARVADVPGIRVILISDGEPDSPTATLAEAKKFKAKIDTIFVGPETGTGRDFLARLAAASGGQTVTAERAIGLLGATQKLLAA